MMIGHLDPYASRSKPGVGGGLRKSNGGEVKRKGSGFWCFGLYF